MNIFDPEFNGMARSEMYRAQVVPELFPHEKPMLVQNWSQEDREAYCGGIYTFAGTHADRPWVIYR